MTEPLHSGIYCGHVLHHRLSPKRHRFVYRVFSLCLDLDELPRLHRKLRWLSVNRFNLFSFHEADHGAGRRGLKSQICKVLNSRGFPEATARINLLCYPRILGYVFNPLSVYFCYDTVGKLRVVIYEVTNTFGERHSYLLPVDDQSPDSWVKQQSDKRMYVSPFMPMATRYRFRILPPNEARTAVCVQQDQREASSPEAHRLFASFTGRRRPLNNRTLLTLFLSYPLMTLKVIAGIHLEALRLWHKGLKLQPREKRLEASGLSWRDQHGDIHHERL